MGLRSPLVCTIIDRESLVPQDPGYIPETSIRNPHSDVFRVWDVDCSCATHHKAS